MVFNKNKKDNKKDKSKNTSEKTIINFYIGANKPTINPVKIVYIFSLIAAIFLIGYYIFIGFSIGTKNIKLATLIQGIKDQKYTEVILTDNVIKVKTKDNKIEQAKIEQGTSFLSLLQREGIKLEDLKNVDFKVTSQPISVLNIISVGIDLMFLLIVAWFASRFINTFGGPKGIGGDPLKGFGASKAQLITPDQVKVRFKDVAGLTEIKEEVGELVDFLKEPKKFWEMGARIPKGVLFEGPPGTGKTLVAKAIAGEAQVPFLYTSGAAFEEMLVGTGAARVRDLFAKARALAPSIIFIDEIDAVAKKRGVDFRASATDQTLNQLLVEMDGMQENSAVIVMAATNRADLLDPALLRPGRFDRKVTFHLPHLHEREAILKVHARNKKFAKDVNLHDFAVASIGLSGAQLENLLNEAAILAVRAGRKQITKKDLWEAFSRISLGPARRYLSITKDELMRTAYHEAGHAIVAAYSKGAKPVQNISIIPRGHALGVTNLNDATDSYNRTYQQLLAMVAVDYGGLVAEILKYGKQDMSTGAASDIQNASAIIRAMIRKFGMSEKLGLLNYGFDSDYVEFNFLHNYSDNTASAIDEEARKIAIGAYKKATEILKREHVLLEKVANALLIKETLTSREFYELVEKFGTEPPVKHEQDEVKSVHDWIIMMRKKINLDE